MPKTTTSWVDSLTTLIGERQRELALGGMLFASTFSMVSILGYVPEDPTFLHPGAEAVQNPCGPLGALIADVLFTGFGFGAWGTLFAMVAAVLALAGRRIVGFTGALMAAGVAWLGLGALHLAFRPGIDHPPGGVVGALLAESLEALLGTFGAWLAVGGGLLMAATIIGQIRWSNVVRWVADRGAEALPPLQNAVSVAGSAAHNGSSAVAKAASSQVKRGIRGAVSRSWATMRRMGHSFVRAEEEEEEEFTDTQPQVIPPSMVDLVQAGSIEDLVGDPDLFVPQSQVEATAVGNGVALAEVRWEPTEESSASSEVLGLFPQLTPRPSSVAHVFSNLDAGEPTRASDEDPCTSPSEIDPPSQPLEMRNGPAIELPPPVVSTPVRKAREVAPPKPQAITPEKIVIGAQVSKAAFLDVKADDDGGAVGTNNRETPFELPRLSLLDVVPPQEAIFDSDALRQLAITVEDTLASFKVKGEVMDVRVGPVVTTFEFVPAKGVSVRKVANLGDDLAMALKALSVRIVAPIPGKGCVGIEVPSQVRMNIYLRELMASKAFRETKMALPMVLGKDVEGAPVVADLAKMPHLLVGGTTGSGKSVGINGMLMSLLFTKTPDQLRLLLVDPKKLEFKLYEDIPHLLHPVVTEPNQAAAALAWACREMDRRYELLAQWETRNINNYNEKVIREQKDWTYEKARHYAPQGWPDHKAPPPPEKLPFIVIVIDELADLMLVAKKEVEGSIARLTQMARACGIHLIVATQRPSVDVITGLIKSNLPTRISFKLRTGTDSRTILDVNGAESLLGRGDMLYLPNGADLVRAHGAFVSDDEVGRVAQSLRDQHAPNYVLGVTADASELPGAVDEDVDVLFEEAREIVISANKASTSMIQRHLKIGYNRAARIVDQLEARGVIGPADGARARKVLV